MAVQSPWFAAPLQSQWLQLCSRTSCPVRQSCGFQTRGAHCQQNRMNSFRFTCNNKLSCIFRGVIPEPRRRKELYRIPLLSFSFCFLWFSSSLVFCAFAFFTCHHRTLLDEVQFGFPENLSVLCPKKARVTEAHVHEC